MDFSPLIKGNPSIILSLNHGHNPSNARWNFKVNENVWWPGAYIQVTEGFHFLRNFSERLKDYHKSYPPEFKCWRFETDFNCLKDFVWSFVGTNYDKTAESAEQDQTARMCRLILVYTLRKINSKPRPAENWLILRKVRQSVELFILRLLFKHYVIYCKVVKYLRSLITA